MFEITSPQNPRVKNAVRLREARHRREQRLILIDGAREISRAMKSGVRMTEVFVCPSLATTPESQALLNDLRDSATPDLPCDLLEVSPAVFEKLTFGDRAEGVLAVAETPSTALSDISLARGSAAVSPLVVILEGVEKPGNLGAVLRSADAAGVSALIVSDSRIDLYNPNAIRASLGTIFSLPVCEVANQEALSWLRQQPLRIFAARVDGSVPYTDADFRDPTAFVLGAEAAGLTPAWNAPDITAIRLPMLGIADSLNVSATAAVLFYETLRQRTGS
jgi:RNA methyltransferase, TrmH family